MPLEDTACVLHRRPRSEEVERPPLYGNHNVLEPGFIPQHVAQAEPLGDIEERAK